MTPATAKTGERLISLDDTMTNLFEPYELFGLTLPNRVVMAPMTRSRADADGLVGPLQADYYSQRATAGLLVSEAINVSQDAIGSPLTPGLFTAGQTAAWRGVTEAVHDAGGRIFAQLWHTGRVGHSSVRAGVIPVAPSAIPIRGQQHFTPTGPKDYETPRALTTEEVKSAVEDYRSAAQNAHTAGFDGVEIHGAFGYLPNQFLVDGANQRTDAYGGSIANRCRFVIEIVEAAISVWGPGRVGLKVSPSIPFNSISDSDPTALFTHLIGDLNTRPLAYIHLMQAMFPLDDLPDWPKDPLATFGPLITAPMITNGGYTRDSAMQVVADGRAHLVSFGAPYVANPDLVHRLARNAPLAEADRATMYGGGGDGYTTYPALSDP